MNVSRRFRTACLMPVCATVLVSCAWTGGSSGLHSPPGNVPAHTDPHLRRFYALQAEIDRLQQERDRLARRLVEPSLALSQQAVGAQAAMAVGTRTGLLQTRVDRMLSRLDQLKQKLSETPVTVLAQQLVNSPSSSEPSPSAHPAIPLGQQTDVSGGVQKTAQSMSGDGAESIPQADRDAGDGQLSPRWSYSVVYRYGAPQPWDVTWERLEEQGEQDKWRGQQAQRNRYFIYVGVYAGEGMAQRRANELLAKVGEAPDILARQKFAQ